MDSNILLKLNENELNALKSKTGHKTLSMWELKDIGFIYLRPLNFNEINSILGIYLSPEELQTAAAMKIVKKLLVLPSSEEEKNKVVFQLFMKRPAEGALMLMWFMEKLEASSFAPGTEI